MKLKLLSIALIPLTLWGCANIHSEKNDSNSKSSSAVQQVPEPIAYQIVTDSNALPSHANSYTYTSNVREASGKVVQLTIHFNTDDPLTTFEWDSGTQAPFSFTMSYGPFDEYSSLVDPAKAAIYALDPVTHLPSRWRFRIERKSKDFEMTIESNSDRGDGMTQRIGLGTSGLVFLKAEQGGTKRVWRKTSASTNTPVPPSESDLGATREKLEKRRQDELNETNAPPPPATLHP